MGIGRSKNNNSENKVACFSVVYPSVKKYLPAFLKSLSEQTEPRFDLIIVDDGLTGLMNICRKFPNLNVVTIDGCDSPAKNRELGLKFLISRGYKIVIFCDADDFFSTQRVEVSLSFLRQADIVVNDLVLVDQEGLGKSGKHFSSELIDSTEISLEAVLNRNVFGLSNTATKVECLSNINIPDDIVAVDWYLFTRLLLRGCKATFTNQCLTYYRQHDKNIIGLKKRTIESLEREVQVKLSHFSSLTNFNPEFARRFQLLRCLIDSEQSLPLYLSQILETNRESPFWWDNVLTDEVRVPPLD